MAPKRDHHLSLPEQTQVLAGKSPHFYGQFLCSKLASVPQYNRDGGYQVKYGSLVCWQGHNTGRYFMTFENYQSAPESVPPCIKSKRSRHSMACGPPIGFVNGWCVTGELTQNCSIESSTDQSHNAHCLFKAIQQVHYYIWNGLGRQSGELKSSRID